MQPSKNTRYGSLVQMACESDTGCMYNMNMYNMNINIAEGK